MRRPTVVVAGDDRAARDLAADLRAWLRPRPVRFYPSRGVAYESHLAPPPHLVGLAWPRSTRCWTRRPRDGGAGRRRLRRRAVGEGPRPRAAPARLHARGRRAARPRRDRAQARRRRLRARRPGRGPRPVRGPRRAARHLPGDRGARGPRRALRHRDRVAALVLDLHPALARARRSGSRSRPPPSSPPSTASWPRSPRSRTPRAAPTSPSCCRSTASASCSTCCPDAHRRRDRRRRGRRAVAARPLGRRLRRLPRHRRAPPLRQAATPSPRRSRRASRCGCPRSPARSRSSSARRPPSSPPARSTRPSRSSRSSRAPATRRVVTWPQRGQGERAAYNLQRLRAGWDAGKHGGLVFAEANLRDGFVSPPLKLAAIPEHRLIHRRGRRRAADAPGPRAAALVRRPAHRRHRRPRGPRPRALRRLRHQDRRRRHARLPRPRVPGLGPRLHAGRPAREDLALRRRRRRAPAALQARRHALGHDEGARPPRRPGARRRAAQPLRRAPPPPRLRVPARLRLAARLRDRLPVHARRATSARRSSRSSGTWRPSARWTG